MNPFLTKRALQVLEKLKADEEGEVTWEKGAGYWIGNSRVSSGGCDDLLRLCLLRRVYSDSKDSYVVYEASAEVADVLKNDAYVPEFVRVTRVKPV